MTDWPEIHENVVRQFRIAWEKPDPHAWDGFLDDSVRFVQPMLRDGVGPALWWEEFARTQALLPDLRVEVLRWAGEEEDVFVHIRFVATAGGRPLSWEAVDRLKLSPEGLLLFRESFFDSSHRPSLSPAVRALGSDGGAPASDPSSAAADSCRQSRVTKSRDARCRTARPARRTAQAPLL